MRSAVLTGFSQGEDESEKVLKELQTGGNTAVSVTALTADGRCREM
jgi:hypothetical protein